jgi:hypothetical protein
MQKIIFYLLLLSSSGQAGFNSAGLGGEDKNTRINKNELVKAAPSSIKKDSLADELKVTAENKKKYESEIEGVDLLLGTDVPASKKPVLYLKKAFAQLSLARIFGIKRKTLKEMSQKERDYLMQVKKNCQEVITLSLGNKNLQANAYYLLGLVDLEFDQFDSGQKNLINSLNLDSTRTQTGAIALIIAEHFFEIEKFQDAIKYYQGFYKKLSPTQQTLADYKTAWSYVGLKDNVKAEHYFLRVLRNQKDKSFFEEALRDSAFVASQYKNDAEIIEYANKIFNGAKIRAKYLTQVYRYLLNSPQKSPYQSLVDEILKIEKDPSQKLQMLGLLVNKSRRDVNSLNSLQVLYQISTEMKSNEIDVGDKEFLDIAADLEADVGYFIRTFSDIYIGKLKLPEKTTKEKIGEGLVYAIDWALEHFPDSKKKPILYELLLDYCLDKKSYLCLADIEKKLQHEKKSENELKQTKSRLKIEILAILDQEFQKDPDKFQAQYLERAKEFLEKNKDNPKWKDVAKRIAQLHVKMEQYGEAEPILEKIYNSEKNAENFYRLIFCYFKSKKDQKIKTHADLDRYNDEKIIALKRELFLEDAKKKGEAGNFAEYEKSLKLFLKSNPEPKKAAIAYADFYNKILTKGDLEQFDKEWGSFNAEVGKQSELEPIRLRAFNLMMDKGRLGSLYKLRMQETANKDLFYVNALASLLAPVSGEVWLADLNKVDEQRREYLLGALALTQTQRVVDFFQKNEPKDDKAKKLLLLAYQMRDNRYDANILATDKLKLASLLPGKSKKEESHIEGDLKKFVFPEVKKKAELYSKDIEFLINKTRKLRKQSLEELPNYSEVYRITLLELLSANEMKLFEAIQKSPRPPNLTPEQNQEYSKGLNELAEEYLNQSKEFTKIKVALEEKIKNALEEKKKNEISSMDMNNWDWPLGEQKDILLKLRNCSSGLCGLLYLDHLYNKKTLAEDAYYKFKGGFLLSLRESQILRDYFQNELKAMKQDELLSEWKRRAVKK